MKVAIVCDWLTNIGGAEKVLLAVHNLYPKAPIYTSKYSKKGIDWFDKADVRTGWLQIFPVCFRRLLGPLRQSYFSHLDLSEYDVIISVTGAEAKAVKSGKWLHAHGKRAANPKGIHISFCHVPTQYYWQMYDDYVKNPGFGVLNPLVRFFFKLFVKPMRKADFKAAQRPDYYITISDYAKELIGKYYKRESVVIHPPVEVKEFSGANSARAKSFVASSRQPVVTGGASSFAPVVANAPQDSALALFVSGTYYITTSRQVNWKRIDLAVKACLELKRKLMVVGEGPEHARLVKLAEGSDLIEFVPLVDKTRLAELLAGAKGYLFPSMEPFGIAPVEALAAGCPVIAFGDGGARDYVKERENGLFFRKQTVDSLKKAIVKFEKMKFDKKNIAESVEDYAGERFDREIREFVDEKAN